MVSAPAEPLFTVARLAAPSMVTVIAPVSRSV